MGRTQPGDGSGTTRLQRLRSGFQLVRFENCLFACGATAVGFASAGDDGPATWRLAAAGAVVALVLAFGNVLNDLFDEEADKRSKPWRPLPSGRISRRQGSLLALSLAVAASVISLPLGPVPFGISVTMLVLAYEYSVRLKGIPLVGNLVVASQVGSTIVFGALCAGDPTAATLIGSVLLMLYSLTLEVAKTVEDQDADQAVGLRTIAHVTAPSAHGLLVVRLVALCAVAVAWSGVALDAPPSYWIVLTPLVPLLWLGTRWRVMPPPSPVPVRQMLGASKALWLLALPGLSTIM